MNVESLIELRDGIEQFQGEQNIGEEEPAFDMVLGRINEAIGCEDCRNRGWVVRKSSKNEMGLILACKRCEKYPDNASVAEPAIERINELLYKAES